MRIVILTQWYPPEPGHKGAELARELIRNGHEAVVITGFPNYPGGRIYDGYRVRLLQRETIDGVLVIRLPLYPS
ncbi:MAG: glycosyltransferase WbuB, partial [Actinomycetia bacterium]|nr:glycosyltransferase WbuB [Actinomycetes bacterium]